MASERLDLLKRLLVDEEGYNPVAHSVKGKMHIGYGHLLDQDQTEEELEIMGLEDELDDWTGFELNDEQCERLFEIDVDDAQEDALMVFSQDVLDALNPARWAVIISMLFQMGVGSVKKFKSFIAAIVSGDWQRASDEMLWSNGLRKKKRSIWYTQSPTRCQEAADAMRDGYFIEYQKEIADADKSVDESVIGVSLLDASVGELLEAIASRLGVKIEVVHKDVA